MPETILEDEDERLHFRCTSCGKDEFVDRKAYENGDTGWYVEDEEEGSGVCGGSDRCIP